MAASAEPPPKWCSLSLELRLDLLSRDDRCRDDLSGDELRDFCSIRKSSGGRGRCLGSPGSGGLRVDVWSKSSNAGLTSEDILSRWGVTANTKRNGFAGRSFWPTSTTLRPTPVDNPEALLTSNELSCISIFLAGLVEVAAASGIRRNLGSVMGPLVPLGAETRSIESLQKKSESISARKKFQVIAMPRVENDIV